MNKNAEPMNPLFYNRTVSQLVKIYVLPEIERRIANRIISTDKLPFQIRQFRISQKQESTGKMSPVVEINEEVKLAVKVKPKTKLEPGSTVTLGDIYPDECYIEPPKYNGIPAGYFYWRSTFLSYIFIFDLSYNVPEQFTEKLPTKMHLPLLDIINSDERVKTIKPLEMFKLLVEKNWPPSPGYYPHIMTILHSDPDIISKESFLELIANIFNKKYWDETLNFWKEIGFWGKRINYLERAIKAHYEDDFIASIYILTPQFEGIIVDYLKQISQTVPEHFSDILKTFKQTCLSRNVMLYPKEVLEEIIDFIDRKAFWKKSSEVKDVKAEINRHGIAHGAFTDFECKEISLKLLILFDALTYVLLNDKMLTGNL